MNEVFGITDENRGIYELVNRVKYAISGMRQDHREALPRILARQFSRKLSKQEWSQLHLGLGKTDIAALGENWSTEDIRKVLGDDAALNQEVLNAEDALRGLAPRTARDYFQKAEELAEFMVTGRVTSDNLLRNADSIAHLFGERGARQAVVTEQSIQAIDELTTLYALRKLDEGTRETMANLARDETEGMDFLAYYLADLRKKERSKESFTESARLNGWKGHIPSETRDGSRLIVADDREGTKLASLGYTRLGDYRGAGAGAGVEGGKRGYYFSAVAGNNVYHQGVMQTVQTSAFGVDPRTGRTISGITAGHVPNQMVKVIQRRLASQGGAGRGSWKGSSGGEALLPVYDGQGEVVAYERSMAPERLEALDRNTHLGEMIGAWAGRQAEEKLAQGFNRMLVDRVWEVWERDRKNGRAAEFVNLAGEDLSRQEAEAWELIPAETRAYISEKFGEGGFMVRKDMLDNTVGYRGVSIGDTFKKLETKEEARENAKIAKAFTDTATALMGDKAFPWLVRLDLMFS